MKSAKTRIFLAFALVLILLVGSSIFFSIQARPSGHNNTGETATSTSVPTIAPTVTPSVSPTPQPLFFDDFTGPNQGWYLDNLAGYTRTITNGALILEDGNHTVLTESLPTTQTFSDFTLSVDFTLLQANAADSVGVYLRGDSNLDHDYRIDIYGNNTYSISKEYLDSDKVPQATFLVYPTLAWPLNDIGQQNILTVTMQGQKLDLRINGTFVNSVMDSDYASGQIALFVQNSAPSREVKAAFNSIIVNALPETESTGGSS
jgi:hypothetical protein